MFCARNVEKPAYFIVFLWKKCEVLCGLNQAVTGGRSGTIEMMFGNSRGVRGHGCTQNNKKAGVFLRKMQWTLENMCKVDVLAEKY